MCPIVPTLTCGLLLSNFSFAIARPFSRLSNTQKYLRPSDSTLNFGHNLVTDEFGSLLVAEKVHGVSGPPLSHRTQVRGIAKHFRQWRHGGDHLGTGPRFRRLDPSTSGVQISHDGSHDFLGNDHLDFHDGFDKHWAGL